MGFNDLPGEIQNHLESLADEIGKKQETDFLDQLGKIWEKKLSLFEDQTKALNLESASSVPVQDGRGMLLLTFSGSLLSLGPEKGKKRWMEYSSIKLRADVPDILIDNDTELGEEVAIGKGVIFSHGKLKKTSHLHRIAICPENLDPDEQEKRIREATIFLTNGFMHINRNLPVDSSGTPEQFNLKSMARYMAQKHSMTISSAKLFVEDFLTLAETGMLLGETVTLGKLGKLSLSRRAPQKARIVKHPATGQEMTVEAKPAMGVPKMSFSSSLKNKAASVDMGDATTDEEDT